MPFIDLNFSGWIRGAEVKKASDADGNIVDVSTMKPGILAKKLETGELTISLGDYLYEYNRKAEIEMSDFQASE